MGNDFKDIVNSVQSSIQSTSANSGANSAPVVPVIQNGTSSELRGLNVTSYTVETSSKNEN